MSPSQTVLVSLLFAAAGSAIAQASVPSLHKAVSAALLCEGNPLDTVRSLAALGDKSYDRGFATLTFGEDMSEKNVIILRTPMTLAGAKTSGVILDLSSSYFDFNGWVFSVFEGDYVSVVKHLALKSGTEGKASNVGKFQRSLGVDLEGNRNPTCPKTIGLTPLQEKGKFLLGCGWCNG